MGSFADQLGIKHYKGDPAEVITMQVGKQDHVDLIGNHTEAAHRNERRSSAIDQERAAGCLDENTGLVAPPAAKCIPTSQKSHLNRVHESFSLFGFCSC